ncbi:MAG TPA: hypothetical protein VF319_15820 [Caldimonas sp.]
MVFDLGSLLQQYAGGAAAPANVEEHFDLVAQHAPSSVVSDGLAAAFRSESTPPFGQMVGTLFGAANPSQRAGMLSSLLAGIAPGALSALSSGSGGSGLGGILGRLLPGGAAPPTMTPDQAAQMTPSDVEKIAQHAEQHNPGIVDRMSGFYAEHPQLVKSLGAAALAIAMGQMANRS